MIEIRITADDLTNKDAIRKTAGYLLGLIGDELRAAPMPLPVAVAPTPAAPAPVQTPSIIPPQQAKELIRANALAAQAAAAATKTEELIIVPPPPHPPTINSLMQPEVVEETKKPVNEVEYDARGYPWDERIHSKTKNKNANGTWRYLRGVSENIINNVEDELKKSPDAKPTFPMLMDLISTSIGNGYLNMPQLLFMLKEFDVESIPVIATRPDLIPLVMQRIKEVLP